MPERHGRGLRFQTGDQEGFHPGGLEAVRRSARWEPGEELREGGGMTHPVWPRQCPTRRGRDARQPPLPPLHPPEVRWDYRASLGQQNGSGVSCVPSRFGDENPTPLPAGPSVPDGVPDGAGGACAISLGPGMAAWSRRDTRRELSHPLVAPGGTDSVWHGDSSRHAELLSPRGGSARAEDVASTVPSERPAAVGNVQGLH